MIWRRVLVAVVAALGLFLVAGLWRNVGQLPSTPLPVELPGAYPIPGIIESPVALPTPGGPYPPPLVTLEPYPAATPTALPARVPTLAATAAPAPSSPATATSPPTPMPAVRPAVSLADPLLIESLRRKQPNAGDIQILGVWAERPTFTRYNIRYQSEGQTVTGYLAVPKGGGPYPAIIMNHGYFLQERYGQGLGTVKEADYLAAQGYVVAVSNFRSYAGSDAGKDGGGHFGVDWVYDSLNLMAAVRRLEAVDSARVGVWGHSTGGLNALQAAVTRPDIRAVVVVSTMSPDMVQTLGFLRNWRPWVADGVVRKFGTPDAMPQNWAAISPINYLADARAPIQIHHGLADEEVTPRFSEELWAAMQTAGVPGEYYTYPGADHLWQQPVQWQRMMERTTAFYDRYLKTRDARS